MGMNRVDYMENSQARITLNEVMNLWGAQVKKVQKNCCNLFGLQQYDNFMFGCLGIFVHA